MARRRRQPAPIAPLPGVRAETREAFARAIVNTVVAAIRAERQAARPCPACGGVLTRVDGVIAEPVIGTGGAGVRRVARPAVFLACGSCEHCEEVGR